MAEQPDFAALFLASPYPYLLVDTDFIIIGANPAYLRATGRTADDIVGKHIFEAFPANPDDPGSTNLDEVRASIALAISTREPHTSALLRYAVPRVTPHGTVFDERYWSAVHSPVFDAAGNVAYVAQNAIDVTDLYRFNAATRQYDLQQNPHAVPDIAQMNRPQLHEAMTRILTAERSELQRLFGDGNDAIDASRAHLALSEKIAALEEVKASQAFQLELADRIRHATDLDSVTEAACALLGRKLAVARVLYAEVDEDKGMLFARRDWTAAGIPSLAGQTWSISAAAPHVTAALRSGQTVVNNDVGADPRTADHQNTYQQMGVRAALLIPFVKAGVLRVVLTIQSTMPRDWQASELRLVHEMAERTWSAVEAAQAQAALRAERDQSQYIFDGMAEGFAVLDRSWTILRMNAEGLRLTRRATHEVIGRNHWDVWPELKGTDTEQAYRRVMATGRTEIIEMAYVLPDRAQVWLEIRVHRSFDHGIAFFFRDVTKRRTAQEQLTAADRRKDEFLAMLAHELRNPLAPIGAAADLLQVAKLDEARVRHTSQIIGRQVRHMTSLVDDLLDVSRVTRGLIVLCTESLDLRAVAADAVEQVAPLMRARGHHLALALAPDTPCVAGDKKRLVQVLANLLANAAKYTHDGGRITLSTAVEDGAVVLHVQDDGIGMAPELAARAFDLFTQAERSSDRALGGLGLGLALVKSLVGLHHGTVHCSSPGTGQGSTFTVRLPVLSPDAAVHAAPAPAISASAPGQALDIMVVDDNADAAAMLAMLLESCGHAVAVEHGAVAALARCEHGVPAVCLLDIGLPEIDGYELARRLRAQHGGAAAVLVAITGYGQEQDRARSAAAGFDHHLVKPVDMEKLQAILAGAGRSSAT